MMLDYYKNNKCMIKLIMTKLTLNANSRFTSATGRSECRWMGHGIYHNMQIQEKTRRSCNPIIRSQSYHSCFAYSYIPPAEARGEEQEDALSEVVIKMFARLLRRQPRSRFSPIALIPACPRRSHLFHIRRAIDVIATCASVFGVRSHDARSYSRPTRRMVDARHPAQTPRSCA